MNLEVHKQIESITKFTIEMQNQQLRIFARLQAEERLVIMKLQKSLFYGLRQKNNEVPLDLLSYASLVLAIKQHHDDFDEVDKKLVAIKKRVTRKARSREKLLCYWALIKTLRNDKQLSFREISRYLQKYHKFEVAHSTIYELWKELEITKFKNNKESKNDR